MPQETQAPSKSSSIARVTVHGLHGQHNLDVQLKPGLNILYGKNGTGKTTFLHILANLLDRDIARFLNLRFKRVIVVTAEGTRVKIEQDRLPVRLPERAHESVVLTVFIDDNSYGPITSEVEPTPELRARLKEVLGGRPVYLPAFRSVLEAISDSRGRESISSELRDAEVRRIWEREQEDQPRDRLAGRSRFVYQEKIRAMAAKTLLCREWFGAFVPTVRFPSLWEVAEELSDERQNAELAVAATDRAAFAEVFVDVLRAVVNPNTDASPGEVQALLNTIEGNLSSLRGSKSDVPEVYTQIAGLVREQGQGMSDDAKAVSVLRVYDKVLQKRSVAQKAAYEQIRTFESSVNRFLLGKALTVSRDDSVKYMRRGRDRMITLQDGRDAGFAVLSSGERHVLTLLFSATHMSTTDGTVLIDEPELSLHVGWQAMILDEMIKQSGNRQIIACTHAPEVAALHRQVMVELLLRPASGADAFAGPEGLDDPILPD